jgi:hypothetical protein
MIVYTETKSMSSTVRAQRPNPSLKRSANVMRHR